MFEIDLKSSAEEQRTLGMRGGGGRAAGFRPFVPGIGLVLALLGVLWLVNRSYETSIAARQAEVRQAETVLNQRRTELAEISGKRRSLIGVQAEEVYWSDVLRMLSEKTPDKVWVTKVKVESSGGGDPSTPVVQTVAVEGGVLSNASEGNLDLIGRYLDEVQRDPRYRQNFGPATLESVTRAGGDPQSLVFRVLIPFRAA